jgi:hypothetical protein
MMLACLMTLTALAFILFPEWLASWVAVQVFGISVALFLVLSLVLSCSVARPDPNKVTCRLALVLWFFLLISEEMFDRAGGSEIEGHFSIVAYGEISLWILAMIVLLVLLIRNTGCLNHIFSGQSKWLFSFAAICMLSAVYSPQPPEPLLTLRRGSRKAAWVKVQRRWR